MRDIVFEAIERSRRRSTLQRFIKSPLLTMREQRYLLYLISGGITMACAVVAFYMGVDPMNIGILAFMLAIVPPSFFDLYETSRAKKLEAEFPAMMRDISLSVKSGMTLKGAMSIAAEGQYGALTPAIKQINNMISWGIPFEDALRHFSRKYPTPLIRRTVFTLIEASRMGGQLGEILEGLAADAEETKALERKRSSETKPYLFVCYISYFVFLAVILIMSYAFLPMMKEAADVSAGGEALPGGIGQFAISDKDLALYERLYFHALLMQGFFAGIVTGKIGEGRAVAGLKHSIFFVVVAVIAYTLLI
ncbi:MAG: type II secretion system F family protein [Dehalococcoidia bacterium]|nr:type II secretion system F family protein [Dehalococcoidia bacterium]